MDQAELGKRVRAARAYGGWTDAAVLAKRIGIGRATLLKIEAGKRAPKTWELIALAEYCNVPREFFTAEWVPHESRVTPEQIDTMLSELQPADDDDDPLSEAPRAAAEARRAAERHRARRRSA